MSGVTYIWLGPEWLTLSPKYCPRGMLEPGFDLPEGSLPQKAIDHYVKTGEMREVVEEVRIVHPPKVVAPPDTDTDTAPQPKAKKKAPTRRKRSK